MGIFDGFKKWFKQADDVQEMADNAVDQARVVTKMIPGDADDKLVDAVADKVEDMSQKFDDLKKNIPGQDQTNQQR